VEISNLNCHEKTSLQQNPKQRDRMQNLWRPPGYCPATFKIAVE
jgi:hypothetical protein